MSSKVLDYHRIEDRINLKAKGNRQLQKEIICYTQHHCCTHEFLAAMTDAQDLHKIKQTKTCHA